MFTFPVVSKFQRLRWLALPLISVLLLQWCVGCSSSSRLAAKGKKYRYTYLLSEPQENKNLVFRDRTLAVSFQIDDAAVRYQVQNLTRSVISIDSWRASLGVNNVYTPVRNTFNFYSDSARAMSSILVPASGSTRDILIPRDNIKWDGSAWIERDLLPTTDGNSPAVQKNILKNVGSLVDVVLPVRTGVSTVEYHFKFRVVGVKAIPWETVQPPVRPPPPLPPKRGITAQNMWLTIGIATGILGISTYLILMKKKQLEPL